MRSIDRLSEVVKTNSTVALVRMLVHALRCLIVTCGLLMEFGIVELKHQARRREAVGLLVFFVVFPTLADI